MNCFRRTLKESSEHYLSFRKWRISLKIYRPVTTTSSYEEYSDINKDVTFKNNLRNEDVPSDHILRSGLRLLKGDIEELKQNIKHRKIELDIEEMVSKKHLMWWFLKINYLVISSESIQSITAQNATTKTSTETVYKGFELHKS